MHSAILSLDLDSLVVVYAGDKEFVLSDTIKAVPLTAI
jgi:hypothetical protein